MWSPMCAISISAKIYFALNRAKQLQMITDVRQDLKKDRHGWFFLISGILSGVFEVTAEGEVIHYVRSDRKGTAPSVVTAGHSREAFPFFYPTRYIC